MVFTIKPQRASAIEAFVFFAELRRDYNMVVIIKPQRASAIEAFVFFRGVTQRL